MKRLALRAAKVLGWVLLALLGSVLGLFLMLLHPRMRSELSGYTVRSVNAQTGWILGLGHLDRIDPFGIDLRNLTLADGTGNLNLSIREVSLRLSPLSLLGGELLLSRVRVAGVRGSFMQVSAQEEESNDAAKDDSATSNFGVRVSSFELDDASLALTGLGPVRNVSVTTVRAAGAYADRSWLMLTRADLEIAGSEEALLRLVTRASHWDERRGGVVQLTGSLVNAPLELTARVQNLDGSTWPRGSLKLRVSALAPEAWAVLGVSGAELRVPATLLLKVNSQGEHVDASAQLDLGPSKVSVVAGLSANQLRGNLNVQSEDLSQVSGVLPALAVQGTLHAQAVDDPSSTKLSLRWRELSVDRQRIPDGEATGTIEGEILRLLALRFDDLAEALDAHAVWNLADSSGELELALNELDLRRVAQAQRADFEGVLTGRVALSMAQTGAVQGEANMAARRLKAGSVRVADSQIALRLRGTLTAPRLRLDASMTRLVAAEGRLSSLTLEGDLDPREAKGRLHVRGDELWFLADLDASGLDQEVLRFHVSGVGQARELPVALEVRGQYAPSLEEVAAAVFLSSAQSRITAHASFDQRRKLHAQADLSFPKLEQWSWLTGRQDLGGAVRGQVAVDGALEAPSLSVELQAQGLRVARVPPFEGSLRADASLKEGKVSALGRLWSEKRDTDVNITVDALIPRKRGELDFAALNHHAEIHARLPVALVSEYAGPKFQGLGGEIRVDASSLGTKAAPVLNTVVEAKVTLPTEALKPELVRIELSLDSTHAALMARAIDQEGELLVARGEASWAEGEGPLSTSERNALPRFSLDARLSSRRLDTMHGVLASVTGAYRIDLPVRASAELELAGDGKVLNGSARAQLLVHGDKLDPHCALGAQTEVALGFDLKDNDIVASARAVTGGGGSVEATLRTRLLLGAKEPGAFAGVDALELKAKGRAINLPTLPGLCDLAGGKGEFDLYAKASPTRIESAQLRARLEDIQAERGDKVSLALTAALDQKEVRASGQLNTQGKQVGTFEARAPIQFEAGPLPSIVSSRPLYAKLQLTRLPLGPLMSLGEGLGRPRGHASGTLSLTGTLDAPEPQGVLDLKDVGFSIASIAQPFRDIDGRISLRGRKLKVAGLTARDRSGKLSIDGEAWLNADGSGASSLRVVADDFPLRRQGEIVAKLTTTIGAKLELDTARKLHGKVRVQGGRLWLVGAGGRKVQSLRGHPDITFADEETRDPDSEVSSSVSVSLADLSVRTEPSLWVMHRDFAVQVGLELGLEQAETFKLTGGINLVRGNLQLLGRTFDIERGRIRFTGDFPPDPEIELRAVYETATGEDLYVELSGRSSAPVLSFSGAATNAGEAVAVLSGGGRVGAESQAQNDARNFAAGLTAGLLSVTIREEFGDWVPIIIVETDDTGAPAKGRAGFEASQLIPPFLKGIARGAYVEGIVGNTSQSGGSVGLGARLEIALPYDFVTSTGYGPGPTWEADLLWAP